jgi:membrane-associated phospholipid phosphatase
MDDLHQAELKVIAALQNCGDFSVVMNLFSYFGYEVILGSLVLIYLSINSKAGVRLLFVFLLGGALQNIFKLGLHLPRPYWIDPHIQTFGLKPSTNYGMPSGHSQWATSCWLALAAVLKKVWACVAALVIILLVAISRVYLGFHFFSDVFGGFLLGLIVLALYFWLERKAGPWLGRLGFWAQIATALLVALTVILAGFALRATIAGTHDPEAWAALASKARDLSSLAGAAGGILGAGAGLAMARRWARFDAGGPLLKRAIRLVIGGLGVYGIIKGLEKVFPRDPEALALALTFIRAALGGWWLIFLAPWLFLKWRWAEPTSERLDAPKQMGIPNQ